MRDNSILSNEAALSLKDLWNRIVVDRLHDLVTAPDEILILMEENGLFPPMYNGEQHRNSQILMLAHLFTENKIELPLHLKDCAREAIANELHEDRLSEWSDPKERKQELARFCSRIGIPMPRAKRPPRTHLVPCENIGELLQNIERWRSDHDAWEREYPTFCKVVDAFIESQLGWEYDNAFIDSTRQRLTLLCFYLASTLYLPREITDQLVSRAAKYVWPGVFDPKRWKP
jgi:hypothetical protein